MKFNYLNLIASILSGCANLHEELSFSVVGHTDGVGGDAYNLKLSKLRAESVVKYLNNRYSVNLSRMKPDGKGKTQLKLPKQSESAENRRVEIVTIQLHN